jgi:hypothetical protein
MKTTTHYKHRKTLGTQPLQALAFAYLVQQRDAYLEGLHERMVPEGHSHLAVLGHGPLLGPLVHLRHQLVQDLQADHAVDDRVLQGGSIEGSEVEKSRD